MNLVDFEVNGPRSAYDAVVARARAHGLEVTDSEIVGLVPEAALGPGDAEHVRLAGFDPGTQVLERLIEEAHERTVGDIRRRVGAAVGTVVG